MRTNPDLSPSDLLEMRRDAPGFLKGLTHDEQIAAILREGSELTARCRAQIEHVVSFCRTRNSTMFDESYRIQLDHTAVDALGGAIMYGRFVSSMIGERLRSISTSKTEDRNNIGMEIHSIFASLSSFSVDWQVSWKAMSGLRQFIRFTIDDDRRQTEMAIRSALRRMRQADRVFASVMSKRATSSKRRFAHFSLGGIIALQSRFAFLGSLVMDLLQTPVDNGHLHEIYGILTAYQYAMHSVSRDVTVLGETSQWFATDLV